MECNGCGAAFLSPRPSASRISQLYSSDYFSGAGAAGIGYVGYSSPGSVDAIDYTARQRVRLIAKHLPLAGSDLLEVGCATGEFANAARRAGARVVGCDYSSDAIELAKRRYRSIRFVAGDVERIFPAHPSFDVVAAFEVIEHLIEPSAWMRHVARLLKDGGWLVISTPNYACG